MVAIMGDGLDWRIVSKITLWQRTTKNAEHFCHVLRPKRLSRLPILGRT